MESYRKIIKRDMFNITSRLKQIDKDYFIVYNCLKNCYEVHHGGQLNGSYCLTSPYKTLDYRLIEYVHKTSLRHNKNLLEKIEENNKKINKEILNNKENKAKTIINDIYSIANNTSKNLDIDKSFVTKWV